MVDSNVLHGIFLTGTILLATGLYGSYMVYTHSGSPLAKLAVQTNAECLVLWNALGVADRNYVDCNSKLQKLIRTLVNTREIDVKKCRWDKENPKDNRTGYCAVWVWYIRRELRVTDATVTHLIPPLDDSHSNSSSEKKTEESVEIPIEFESSSAVDGDILDKNRKKVEN